MRLIERHEMKAISGGVTTGLGSNVDAIINASTRMSTEVGSLLSQNWTIGYSDKISNSFTDSVGHHIYIASSFSGQDANTVGQLSHELGHAQTDNLNYNVNNSSQSIFTDAMLHNEGGAQINSILIAKELSGKGINVPVQGDTDHVLREIAAMNTYLSHLGDPTQNPGVLWNLAASAVGHVMADEKLASGQTYFDYYNQFWTDHHAIAPVKGAGSGGASGDGVSGIGTGIGGGLIFVPYTPIFNPTVTVGADEHVTQNQM